MEAGWSARQVSRQLGRSDCVARRCWDQWIREMSFTQISCSGRPRQTSRREDRHIVRRQEPGDESRFNLISDHNRVRAWRPRGKRLNPAFALQKHTAPTTGVIELGAIAYNTGSPIVLIRGTMTAQWYVHDILQTHVLQLMQWLPGAIFQEDNVRPHTTRMSKDCFSTVTNLPWPTRYPDLSPIEYTWERQVGYPTSLIEIMARSQQIWNEMSQDIMQNLYASMPDRIVSCIHARGGSTWC
ncbi:transposable element Tcb1 transposase [Trichonephila clavipes]|nr:transposable element Tcb1 transposase [Trichonephila clavipes]